MGLGIRIRSSNLSGETVFVTLLQNGVTYNLGENVIPFDVYTRPDTGKLSGLYTLYSPKYVTNYEITIPNSVNPTPTPTITPTSTNTPTPTITPTITPTPGLITPSNLFMQLEGTDYTSGTWNDRTANNNIATINDATWSSDHGGVFIFNGVSSNISIPHNSSLSLSTTIQKTIQVWVKFDTLPLGNSYMPVFGKLSASYSFDGYWSGVHSSAGNIRIVTIGETQNLLDSTLIVSANTWYLLTFISQVTNEANTTKVYINTTEYISTQHGTDVINESNPLYLGYIGSNIDSLYLNGKIGACYFYTKGLTIQEITNNYINTKARYELTPTPTPTSSRTN